jgi:hypothetical protein
MVIHLCSETSSNSMDNWEATLEVEHLKVVIAYTGPMVASLHRSTRLTWQSQLSAKFANTFSRG